MPRALKYDRRQALERAVDLFWLKGYQAASLKQIELALDMRPGSLYAAFGSKQDLLLEALGLYAEQMFGLFEWHLARADSPLAGFKGFVHQLVLGDTDQGLPAVRACLMVKMLLELGDDSPRVNAEINRLLEATEVGFERMLRSARAAGELRRDLDCQRLARLLQVQIMGLRSYAQRDLSRADLEILVSDVCDLVDTYAQVPVSRV